PEYQLPVGDQGNQSFLSKQSTLSEHERGPLHFNLAQRVIVSSAATRNDSRYSLLPRRFTRQFASTLQAPWPFPVRSQSSNVPVPCSRMRTPSAPFLFILHRWITGLPRVRMSTPARALPKISQSTSRAWLFSCTDSPNLLPS